MFGYWFARRTTIVGSPPPALEEVLATLGLGIWGDGRSGPAPLTRRSRSYSSRASGMGRGD